MPLIMGGPNIKPNSFCRTNVIGYDLFPTFCELANISSLPDHIEGVSLVPLLQSNSEMFNRSEELVFHFPHYGAGPRQVPQSAILAGSWKLTKWYETNQLSLFDLSKDIGEATDLSKQDLEKTAELNTKLAVYLKRVNAQLPTPNSDYDPVEARAEMRERRANTAGRGKRTQNSSRSRRRR